MLPSCGSLDAWPTLLFKHMRIKTWPFWDFPMAELKSIGILNTELHIPTPTTAAVTMGKVKAAIRRH
jgi:hypothetical protein